MTAYIKKTVKDIYREHGLIAFLFFFIPLIPGFIEHHTHTYLSLIRAITGIPPHPRLHPTITKVFGDRGAKVLTFHRLPFTIITPAMIENAFFIIHNPELGLNLMSHFFFDKRQRQYPHSDKYRTKVIALLPEIFRVYHTHRQQLIRTTVLRKIALLACIEQALDPRHMIIEQFTALCNHTAMVEHLRRESHYSLQMDLLGAKIKAELAGRATAGDPAFFTAADAPQLPHHLLTLDDVRLIKMTLKRLTGTSAVEIALDAHTALRHLNTLDLTLRN